MEVVLKSENLSLLYIHEGMMKCQKIFLDTRFDRSGSLYDRSPRDLEIMKRVFSRSRKTILSESWNGEKLLYQLMDQSVLKLSIFSTDRRSSLQLSYFDEEEGKKQRFSRTAHREVSRMAPCL